jgi:hypothetical protein
MQALSMLAQAQPAGHRDTSVVVTWVVVLIGVIMVGGLVLMWMRRKIFAAEAAEQQASGLMESLRKMRDSGQMSQEEYDATRKAMATRIAGGSPAAAPASPTKPTPKSRRESR